MNTVLETLYNLSFNYLKEFIKELYQNSISKTDYLNACKCRIKTMGQLMLVFYGTVLVLFAQPFRPILFFLKF